MSKSLGNLVKVSRAMQRGRAAAVRLYLVSHRWGRDGTFTWAGLARYTRLVDRLRKLIVTDASKAKPGSALMAEFNGALSDDLDTPRAVRALRAALAQKDAAAVRAMLAILAGTAFLPYTPRPKSPQPPSSPNSALSRPPPS